MSSVTPSRQYQFREGHVLNTSLNNTAYTLTRRVFRSSFQEEPALHGEVLHGGRADVC